jgi:hypothetical protein
MEPLQASLKGQMVTLLLILVIFAFFIISSLIFLGKPPRFLLGLPSLLEAAFRG